MTKQLGAHCALAKDSGLASVIQMVAQPSVTPVVDIRHASDIQVYMRLNTHTHEVK